MSTYKTILITGASTGIGKATAELFAQNNCKVYNLDFKAPAYTDPMIEFIQCDVSNFDSVNSAVNAIMAKETELNYVFTNAGVHVYATLEDTTLEEIDRLININLKGQMYVLKCTMPIMKKQKKGRVVIMGSDTALIGKPSLAVYSSTKGALGELVKCLAIDCAPYNICVNGIFPGTTETPLLDNSINNFAKSSGESVATITQSLDTAQPMHTIGTPRQIALAVQFLCNDEMVFMTGSHISVDGGSSAQ